MQELIPYLLENAHLRQVREMQYAVAILPWGATEAHNYHLPYGTDTFETSAIATESARIAWESGARCVVLPTIPFGVNTGQHDIPGTINMYPTTQAAVINDVLESMQHWGIGKFILLNGHGGNDFRQILRELGAEFPDMLLVTCNWFQAVDPSGIIEEPGDHAGELETSLMMHIHPKLVLPLSEAGSGESKKFSINALNEKWAWSERKWTKVSRDTGIGNPSKSSSEKGELYFEKVCEKISRLIVELSSRNKESLFN